MAGMVEWCAREHCPFSLKQTSQGEAVEFHYAKAMLCVTKAFGLNEVGKLRSLSVATSIDGASLSKNLSIVAGGVKLTDRGAWCPITNRLLLDNPATMSAPSRNLCILLKILMGRETKETFHEFASLFQFFNDLSKEGSIPTELEGFKPFSCMTNCDLSAQWKGLCKGGAAKVHTLPCIGCATESENLATPNARACTRWCHEHSQDPDWMCFHKPMATSERIASISAEVEELVSTLQTQLEDIQVKSKMMPHNLEESEAQTASSVNDALSVNFTPTNPTQRQMFSCLLTNELMLRGLDINGTLEEWRDMLIEAMRGESMITKLSKEIAHEDVKDGAYFLLISTLPCVLHMENQNGIKMLTMVLIEGLAHAKKKLLYPEIYAEGTRVSLFVSDIESLINRTILGTKDDPCQWMCPFDAQKKEIGPITMDNVRTRKIIDSLDTIVSFCVPDQGRKSLWTKALENYQMAMVLVWKEMILQMQILYCISTVQTYSFRRGLFSGRRRESQIIFT
jgi:hypothetical protein